MDSTIFKANLTKTDLTLDEKVEMCQHYLDNYAVNTKTFGWTKLSGIVIKEGREDVINKYFNKLCLTMKSEHTSLPKQ